MAKKCVTLDKGQIAQCQNHTIEITTPPVSDIEPYQTDRNRTQTERKIKIQLVNGSRYQSSTKESVLSALVMKRQNLAPLFGVFCLWFGFLVRVDSWQLPIRCWVHSVELGATLSTEKKARSDSLWQTQVFEVPSGSEI